ncbi:hypothetical protein FB562_2611 [Homoserinimonas aerilata]|uniref:O-antigen ligase-like membrane protein n=1 Tax=Homoserinimonas aerilata TaxID=1162970 RepID=A0A542Y1R3_9MICO|nr:hypothetical protein [Homoserinimonas aerilata]TQL42021.1 hypothetical protein FB562_2611 [Homoserinimonas aerilata]
MSTQRATRRRLDRDGGAPRREIDAVGMLTVYLVLLLAIPSGVTIGLLGTLGRPSLIWGLVLLAWWVISRLQARESELRPVSQPVSFAFMAFFVLVLVSFAAAMLRGQPDDQVSPALTALIRLLSWAGVLLVAVDGIRTLGDLTTMARRIGIGAGLLATLGLLQFVTGQALVDFFGTIPGLSLAGGLGERAGVVRSSGTAIHPLEYATALNAALPLVIAAAISRGFQAPHSRGGLRWWLPVALISVSSMVAVSRSAIIGFAVAVVSMIPALSPRSRIVAIGVGGVLGVAVFAAVPGLLTTTVGLFAGAADDPKHTVAHERPGACARIHVDIPCDRFRLRSLPAAVLHLRQPVGAHRHRAGRARRHRIRRFLRRRHRQRSPGEAGIRTAVAAPCACACRVDHQCGRSVRVLRRALVPDRGRMLFLLAGLCGSVRRITWESHPPAGPHMQAPPHASPTTRKGAAQ